MTSLNSPVRPFARSEIRLRLKLNSLTQDTSPVVNDGRGLVEVQASFLSKSNSELKTLNSELERSDMAPIVEYEGEQLEIDFALPQFSLCPSCASQVITIALWLWCLWLEEITGG